MRNSGIITIIGLMIVPLLFIFLIVKIALYYANPPKKKSEKDTISQEQKGIGRFSLKLDSQMPKRTKVAAITLIIMFIFSVLNIILLTISLFLISSTTNSISTFLYNAIIIIISLVITFLAIRLINNRKLSGLIIGFIVAIYCIIIFIFARSLTSIIGLVFGILVIVGLTGKDAQQWFRPATQISNNIGHHQDSASFDKLNKDK